MDTHCTSLVLLLRLKQLTLLTENTCKLQRESHNETELNFIDPFHTLANYCKVPGCINMSLSQSQGILDFSGNQRLQCSRRAKRSSASSRPACLCCTVTVNRAPTRVHPPPPPPPPIDGAFPARSNVIAVTPCGEPRAAAPPTNSASVPQNLPVSPPFSHRDSSCLLPASHLCVYLHPSTYISARGCRRPGAAHLTAPSHTRLAGSLCRRELKQRAADSGGRTDRRTEAEIASGLSNSRTRSFNLDLSLSLSLTHALARSLKASSSLFQPY